MTKFNFIAQAKDQRAYEYVCMHQGRIASGNARPLAMRKLDMDMVQNTSKMMRNAAKRARKLSRASYRMEQHARQVRGFTRLQALFRGVQRRRQNALLAQLPMPINPLLAQLPQPQAPIVIIDLVSDDEDAYDSDATVYW